MNRREALKSSGAFLGLVIGAKPVGSQQRDAFEPLGRVGVDGAKEAVVGADKQTVYVATRDGFAVVDITDPTDPTVAAEARNLLADREKGPLGRIHDVKVEGDRLVVAGPASQNDDYPLQGFLLYDVSDPANPQQLAFHETGFPIHNAFVLNDIAYLTGNNGEGNPLVMVDISDDQPEEVGRWSMLDVDSGWSDVAAYLRTLHDIWVQDGVAYLVQWDAGTWIVDVSDPANPEHLATVGGKPLDELAALNSDEQQQNFVEPPGNDHYCMVNDDASLLAVGKESSAQDPDASDGKPSGIDLWDVSDLSEPTRLSTIAPPSPEAVTPADVQAASYGVGSATCHECGTNVSHPWTTAHNFDVVGDRLYSSWYQGGVKVHDISDPSVPEELVWWHDAATTSFWTAKLAGECFVGSSHRNERDGEERLYTFPVGSER